jgi:hypothetical protein
MGVKIVQNVDQDRSTPTEKPTQQVPDESTSSSLNPQPSETTSNYSWNSFIDKAIAISAEQNQGSTAHDNRSDRPLQNAQGDA